MARCANCGCDLPGMEKLCRTCYYQQYWDVNSPKKNFLQRLGRNGDQWLLSICAWLIAAPLCYALIRAPRLMQGIEALNQIFLLGVAWILVPWLLLQEWKQERRLRTLVVGVILAVQIICGVFWWIKGTRIWLQISMTIAIPMIIYGYVVRASDFLQDL